jgi:hypothetical protein
MGFRVLGPFEVLDHGRRLIGPMIGFYPFFRRRLAQGSSAGVKG